MGIQATSTGVGGWTVGSVVGRRPAGTARDAVHPGTGARAVLVIVDGRFTGRGLPDPETVARAAIVGSPAVMPMLDAGLMEDGTRWYVTPPAPGPVLDPAAGCSPRRAATVVESVARALASVHAAGLVHGLVGPNAVVPATGRHGGSSVGTTLLLDTGVAALLGDRADDLAVAAGVTLPTDRGPAADVYALGALLLRLVTAAAPAGPALAALPVPLRSLLSEMLDEHPSRRPTAEAVAGRLAGMREGLLATGPVELPQSGPALLQHPAAPTIAPRPLPPVAVQAAVAAPVVVPPPVSAPLTLESPIVVPRSMPALAPSLWTGPVRIAEPERPMRRRATRIVLLAGGVGLAALILGVATHLPLGHVDGDQAVAAVTANGALSVADAAGTSPSSAVSAPASAHHAKTAAPKGVALPAFVRPVRVVPSPLISSGTSTTPSRNTSSSGSSGSSSPTASPTTVPPTPTSGSSLPATSDPVVTTDPSTPTDPPSSSDPTTSTDPLPPTDSASPSDPPAPSDPTPTDSTTTDPAATDAPSPSAT